MVELDFNLKAHIQGADGKCGQLAGLVIDPEVWQVTNLIVKQGCMVPQQRVVPITMVKSAAQDDVYLSLSSYELDQYPQYRLVEYEAPVTGLGQKIAEMPASYGLYSASEPTVPTHKRIIRSGIAFNQKVIEPDMPVKNLESKIGEAIRLVVDSECNEITYLVVQPVMIFHGLLVIPIMLVEDVFENEILMSGTNETVESLMKYNRVAGIDPLTK